MKKARPPEGKTSAREQGDSKSSAAFLGTSNQRYLRVLAALLARSRTREEIDRIAGASNGPAAITEIRALGLPKPDCLPCDLVPCFDRDGKEVRRGVYSLTPKGRRRVLDWLRKRNTARGANE
jgi:hypothetical protein